MKKKKPSKEGHGFMVAAWIGIVLSCLFLTWVIASSEATR